MCMSEKKPTFKGYLEEKSIGFYEYTGDTLPDFVISKKKGKVIFLFKNQKIPFSLDNLPKHISTDRYHTAYEMSNQLADVAFLEGRAVKALFAGLPHRARFVLVSLRPSIHWLIAGLGLLRRLLSKQLTFEGVKTFSFSNRFWLVLYRDKIKKISGGLLTLSEETGVQKFLDYLREEKVRYVVLRFYENLPDLGREGGDLDILIANEDEAKLRSFLEKHPGNIKVDIWPVVNPNFNSSSYYPPMLARKIIETAVDGPANSRIPGPRESFLSLAYHALYHKGTLSGIPTRITDLEVEEKPDNNYANRLSSMAKNLGIELTITMEGIDEYLHQQGWRPRLDTLAKIAPYNEWVKKRFFSSENQKEIGLRVFIVKQKAIDLGLENQILETITKSGEFIILKSHVIPPEQKKYVADHLRGGVWADKADKTIDYLPAMAVVVMDVHTAHKARRGTKLAEDENLRTKNLKKLLRQTFDRDSTSMVHSTDNSNEAWEYIDVCFPSEVEHIKKLVNELYTKVELSLLKRIHFFLLLAPSQLYIMRKQLKDKCIRAIVE